LLDKNYVESCAGMTDRRQRRLFPTAKGCALAQDLAHLQSERFRRVLAHLPQGAHAQAIAFLLEMVDTPERAKVAAFVALETPMAPAGLAP
jgi:DNA-binding MarR family transcriptional regulator